MRGRKPIPTHLKIARGNPGKRALNDDEPVLPEADVAAPVELKGSARAVWDRLAPGLVEAGVLREHDRGSLRDYCLMDAQVLALSRLIRALGAAESVKKGYYRQMNQAITVRSKVASDLGITPSSRSRVKAITKPDTHKDNRSRFFGQTGTGKP